MKKTGWTTQILIAGGLIGAVLAPGQAQSPAPAVPSCASEKACGTALDAGFTGFQTAYQNDTGMQAWNQATVLAVQNAAAGAVAGALQAQLAQLKTGVSASVVQAANAYVQAEVAIEIFHAAKRKPDPKYKPPTAQSLYQDRLAGAGDYFAKAKKRGKPAVFDFNSRALLVALALVGQ